MFWCSWHYVAMNESLHQNVTLQKYDPCWWYFSDTLLKFNTNESADLFIAFNNWQNQKGTLRPVMVWLVLDRFLVQFSHLIPAQYTQFVYTPSFTTISHMTGSHRSRAGNQLCNSNTNKKKNETQSRLLQYKHCNINCYVSNKHVNNIVLQFKFKISKQIRMCQNSVNSNLYTLVPTSALSSLQH